MSESRGAASVTLDTIIAAVYSLLGLSLGVTVGWWGLLPILCGLALFLIVERAS